MAPYTLNVGQAEAHLRGLATQVRCQRQPALILADDGKALAWLEPLPRSAELRRARQTAQLNAHLTVLKTLLQALAGGEAQPDLLALCREQLRSLYQAAEDASPLFRQGVLLVQLALENVDEATFRPDQALALLFGLDLLQQSAITEDDLRQYNHRLMNSDLYPEIAFDEALLSRYLSET
jgi:hypothetical protein